ncbi:hypothetical protein ABW16_01705 [Mycolicibacter heraklionensis]|uniref:Uncharacterized protein n=1 Tax=Mycolicibacter heraklionensis TaxID=512402 RepID=A0ABR5FKL9_9MYCO|nr:hypothetical protein [Mycolicibacter heraklionensis]KLO31578.1 hypothetical protein ABW16_01705 [Mycolicibacter heraklionensis]
MTFSQGPSAKLDYTVDWAKWLPDGDTIAESEWSVENLTPPVALTLVGTANTGGVLPAGSRYWVITAVDANGETTASNEVSATWADANGLAQLAWPRVPNATAIKVYAGTESGQENKLLVTLGPSVVSFTDDGRAAATTASPPLTNTAALGVTIADSPTPSSTDTTATAFVEGGTVGVVYDVTNHITTAAGREESMSIQISINEQYIP